MQNEGGRSIKSGGIKRTRQWRQGTRERAARGCCVHGPPWAHSRCSASPFPGTQEARRGARAALRMRGAPLPACARLAPEAPPRRPSTSCWASRTRRSRSFSSSRACASSRRTRATLSLFRTCQLFFGRMFMAPPLAEDRKPRPPALPIGRERNRFLWSRRRHGLATALLVPPPPGFPRDDWLKGAAAGVA